MIDVALGELNGLIFTTAERWEAKEFIERWHYSGKLNAVTLFNFSLREPGGLFGDRGPLVACIVFAHPVRQMTAKPLMLELVRLARIEDPPEGLRLSFLVAQSLKWLRLNTDYKMVISYADSAEGHHGGIYQATNFVYVRKSKPDLVYEDRTTGKVHDRKTLYDQYGTSAKLDMAALGLKKKRTGMKYLYVYPLAKGRKAKDSLLAEYGFEAALILPKPDTPGGLGFD